MWTPQESTALSIQAGPWGREARQLSSSENTLILESSFQQRRPYVSLEMLGESHISSPPSREWRELFLQSLTGCGWGQGSESEAPRSLSDFKKHHSEMCTLEVFLRHLWSDAFMIAEQAIIVCCLLKSRNAPCWGIMYMEGEKMECWKNKTVHWKATIWQDLGVNSSSEGSRCEFIYIIAMYTFLSSSWVSQKRNLKGTRVEIQAV